MPCPREAEPKDRQMYPLPAARRSFNGTQDERRCGALPSGAMEARAQVGRDYRRAQKGRDRVTASQLRVTRSGEPTPNLQTQVLAMTEYSNACAFNMLSCVFKEKPPEDRTATSCGLARGGWIRACHCKSRQSNSQRLSVCSTLTTIPRPARRKSSCENLYKSGDE